MPALRSVFRLCLVTLAITGSTPAAADAETSTAPLTPSRPAGVDVEEHLGASLPLDARFRDHRGEPVRLAQLLRSGRPVILNLMYHRCPMLCSVVLDALTRSLKQVRWSVGRDLDVISISIDPRDEPAVAATKRERILADYHRTDAERGWAFLVGDEPNIRRVADAVGFRYTYDTQEQQYAHPAAIFLVTPTGHVARYLYGIDFDPADLRIGLLEASAGRSMSTIDRLILACYRFDPRARKYVVFTRRFMQAGGAGLLLLVGGALAVLWRRERVRGAVPARGV